MEINSLQIHFNKLIAKGFPPSIIRRKMALSLAEYEVFDKGYQEYQNYKFQQARDLEEANKATVEELAIMWQRIEEICFELRIEKDYERIYALENELEDLSIKYSESSFKQTKDDRI